MCSCGTLPYWEEKISLGYPKILTLRRPKWENCTFFDKQPNFWPEIDLGKFISVSDLVELGDTLIGIWKFFKNIRSDNFASNKLWSNYKALESFNNFSFSTTFPKFFVFLPDSDMNKKATLSSKTKNNPHLFWIARHSQPIQPRKIHIRYRSSNL